MCLMKSTIGQNHKNTTFRNGSVTQVLNVHMNFNKNRKFSNLTKSATGHIQNDTKVIALKRASATKFLFIFNVVL